MIDNTSNKVNLIAYVEYCNDFELVYNLLKDANLKKPTEKLGLMISSMHRIALYVNTLEGNTSNMYKAVDEYRESKNRAVIRARKSEEDLHSLEKENLMLKDKFKLKL